MGEQTKNMLIGVFIIAACSLLVSIVFFLKPTVGDGKETLYVRFANVNKIAVGTRVTYAGRPVGEVIEISELDNPREQPTDLLGRYYLYQLKLRLDSSVVVYTTDKIELQTSGLLGEKSVAILPRKPPEGITPRPVDRRPIYADSVDPFENALRQFSVVASTMDKTLADVRSWVDLNGESLACAVAYFGGTMKEAHEMLGEVNKRELVGTLHESMTSMKDLLADAKAGIHELHEKNFFANLASTSQTLQNIADKVDQGEGTLGRVMKGDDLYLRLTSLLTKADTLLADVEQYGILFNLNKGWQRRYAKRAEKLTEIKTPQGFRSYFEEEIGQINHAMNRMTLLLNQAEKSPEKSAIFQHADFQQAFTDLLRRVDTLEDNLKLFNQNLQSRE